MLAGIAQIDDLLHEELRLLRVQTLRPELIGRGRSCGSAGMAPTS